MLFLTTLRSLTGKWFNSKEAELNFDHRSKRAFFPLETFKRPKLAK